MYLTYRGQTSKHYIFTVSLFGGQFEYTPDIVIGSLLLKPATIQAPLFIPGGRQIGPLSIPSPFIVLDYIEYEPLSLNPDSLGDYYDLIKKSPPEKDLIDLLNQIISLDIIAYYIKPGESPADLPEYPVSQEDPSGWTHYMPDLSGGTSPMYIWVACNEYVEGMAIHLPFAQFLFRMVNDLSDGRWDGRYLCMYGGGSIPLIPRFCIYPESLGGLSNFVISSKADWDGNFAHGYGNIPAERTRLSVEGEFNISGWSVRNRYNEAVGLPFYGGTVYADEFIDILTYTPSAYNPDKPRIYPPESEEPPVEGVSAPGVFWALIDNDWLVSKIIRKRISAKIKSTFEAGGGPFEAGGGPFEV